MAAVDLNLLTVLDALLQEGSVTGAARRLHLTPPGVSRSLNRLRSITGDPLLVRVGRNLTPTPTAESLRDRARLVLEDVHDILSPHAELSDSEIERDLDVTFTIRAGSDTAELFGPPLLSIVRARAPRVRLRFLADGPLPVQALPDGDVDLDIGAPLPSDLRNILRERLFTDSMVLVGRRDGFLSRYGKNHAPPLEDLAEVPHAAASRRGVLHGPLDEALSRRGLTREVVVTAPGFASAFRLLRASDLVCLAPAGMTRPLLGSDLLTRPVPVPLPEVTIEQAWHRRTDTHPGHRWLRARVREAALTTCPDQVRATHEAA